MGFWRGKKRYATKEIFERQVKFYDSIKPIYTHRGAAVSIILFLLAIGLVVQLLLIGFSEDFIYSIVGAGVQLPILYFVYHGKRWAIVLMMSLLTLNLALGIATEASFIGLIIWMALVSLLYEALKVENARRKLNSLPHPRKTSKQQVS